MRHHQWTALLTARVSALGQLRVVAASRLTIFSSRIRAKQSSSVSSVIERRTHKTNLQWWTRWMASVSIRSMVPSTAMGVTVAMCRGIRTLRPSIGLLNHSLDQWWQQIRQRMHRCWHIRLVMTGHRVQRALNSLSWIGCMWDVPHSMRFTAQNERWD